ncbi:hypothetical protein [Sinorhizobium americanum]|uniref:Uncharacterized protein n=1 Tax=Sinorhizobium americanum TaxID=194963 RepID=A0A4R2BVX9_9HYPH|nr:hypothetical protein [Sinorhizobium americanum]TCN30339.1 hypothetical protein EV184_108213 [Sinorhizobium americanum]
MIFLCVTPERQLKTQRIMAALQQGSGGGGRLCQGSPPDGQPFVVWGQRWLSEKIVPPAVRQGTDWWYVDNGFYWPANGRPVGYYAITFRGLTPLFFADADPNRLPFRMAGWRQQRGDHVLLALPGQHYGRMLGLDMAAWSEDISFRIMAHTDRPIIIREKGCSRPLAHDLQRAFVVVTHSSKVAVDAVVAGVPAIVAPTNPAAPVCSTELSEIENPRMPERAAWWASLMAQQFTLDEMRKGLAFAAMRKMKDRIDGLRGAAL